VSVSSEGSWGAQHMPLPPTGNRVRGEEWNCPGSRGKNQVDLTNLAFLVKACIHSEVTKVYGQGLNVCVPVHRAKAIRQTMKLFPVFWSHSLSYSLLVVSLFFFFFGFFRDRVSLCSPGCPGTHSVDQAGLELRNPPASASQVLGLKCFRLVPPRPACGFSFCVG
jgi:hypothetical protein